MKKHDPIKVPGDEEIHPLDLLLAGTIVLLSGGLLLWALL